MPAAILDAPLDTALQQALRADEFYRKLQAAELTPDEIAAEADVDTQHLLDVPAQAEDDHHLLGGVIGLNPAQRIAARKRIARACWLGYTHRGNIGYTEGVGRWSINQGRWSADGKYPLSGDCSGYSGYLFRDATRIHHLADFVNAYSWNAGYTGTMTRHGVWIKAPSLIGDQVFYGGSFSVPGHVATYIGGGRCFSHGSSIGPLIVRWNYRTPVQVRRYIR